MKKTQDTKRTQEVKRLQDTKRTQEVKRLQDTKKTQEVKRLQDMRKTQEMKNAKNIPNRHSNHKNVKKVKKKITREERERIEKRIKIIFILLLLILLVTGIAMFLIMSPMFKIIEIKTEGNSQITSEQIIELSNIKINDNIFLIKNNEAKIESEGYIKSAEIKRQLPNKILIKVEERQTAYIIETSEGYAYIDTQGYILEISNIKLNKPILKNYSTQDIQPGNRLNENDLEKLEDVIKIIKSIEDVGITEEITYIDIENKEDYLIYFEEMKKLVYVGNEKNLANKMLYAKGIMENTKDIEGKIFVNGDFNNSFQPYFREESNQL